MLDHLPKGRDFVAVDDGPAPSARRIVVVNWTLAAENLVDALRSVVGGGGEVVCVGSTAAAEVDLHWASLPADRTSVRYVPAPGASDDVDALANVLATGVDIASAHSIIVLPDHHAREPDANSRVTCVAVARACEGKRIPNILVEVRDPEAAYEFAGLGVATVFYPGYLRAALLAHACVDLGVFQFLYGLLRGDLRVTLLPVDAGLRERTFYDAVLAHEEDDDGRPVTLIGVQVEPGADAVGQMVINPGPKFSLGKASGLLALREGL